jgi:pimeloyl-ACP methyl ester carboxylesterase
MRVLSRRIAAGAVVGRIFIPISGLVIMDIRRSLPTLAVLLCMIECRALADESLVSNGVSINYSVKGEGEPVILIHGYLASGLINWDLPGITDALAKDHQVIWLDMPAHGRSDKPTKEEAYGVEMVEHVTRLMDHLKIKTAHVVGYSMGGMITLKLVAKHPDRVRSAALGGMGWLREGSAEQKVFLAGGKDGKPAGLCFKGMAKLALSEDEIKSIRVPVTVLFGDRDFLRKGYLEPLQQARKDWPVIEIKDADHLSCVIRPQFKEELQKWLAKQTAR